MLFGVSNFTYYFAKFINLTILLLSFIYACKYLKLTYLIALIGALIYFSINFVIRFLMPLDTIGNILLLYPLLMIFIVKIIDENKTKDILIFNLLYIFWLSGGHVTWLFMHLTMFFLFYWITIFTFYEFRTFKLVNLKRFMSLFFVLFVIPFLAVLYQYYFIYDVIVSSNRFKEGLIVSPFQSVAWKQLIVSFRSSSYFWVGVILLSIYGGLRLLKRRYNLADMAFRVNPLMPVLLLIGLIYLMSSNIQFASKSNIIADFIPIINSKVFRFALLLYFAFNIILKNKAASVYLIRPKQVYIFLILIFLLSYYFDSPENIIGDANGYDFDLFRELSAPLRVIFTLSILFSLKAYQNNRIVRIIIFSSIVLYLIRSHFTIPLLRFTGIVWYATRDGSIFSFFFAVLFMFGLKNLLVDFSGLFKNKGHLIARYVQYSLLVLILVMLVRDSYNKFYKGTSHRYIYPNHREMAIIPMEKNVVNGREEITFLNSKLLSLNRGLNHFYRIFTPENHYLYLGGNLQGYKIHEAAIYESSISRLFQDFYDYTILKKPRIKSTELKYVMPYFLFTRHVHAGFNLKRDEIQYSDFFMFSPKDINYLSNGNIEFLWDIMQVKYLIIGDEFSKNLEGFTNKSDYKLLGNYSRLSLNLYEITKKKSYSKLAVLPLAEGEDYQDAIGQLNSKDINILKGLYSKLIFPEQGNSDFSILKSQSIGDQRYYEIASKKKAILIDFESWNRNWGLKINDKSERLLKAFQMFKGIKIDPGLNKIELTYNLKYFRGLFLLSVMVIIIYVILLARYCYLDRDNKLRDDRFSL